MADDLLLLNTPQPEFKEKTRHFFITTAGSARRPVTNEALRTFNSAARAFSSKKVSAFENEYSNEEKRIQTEQAARNFKYEYDEGTLEKFMQLRECNGELPRNNIIPKSFNSHPPLNSIFRTKFEQKNEVVGNSILQKERINQCQNITEPEERDIDQKVVFPSIFTPMMNNYEEDMAYKVRELHLLEQQHSEDYISKNNAEDVKLYREPKYRAFLGQNPETDIKLRSHLYENDRKMKAVCGKQEHLNQTDYE